VKKGPGIKSFFPSATPAVPLKESAGMRISFGILLLGGNRYGRFLSYISQGAGNNYFRL
jgi:hypothetical protein